MEQSEDMTCRIAVQAVCGGVQRTNVRAFPEGAAPAKPHITVTVGRVIVVVEDRAALASFESAWSRAVALADAVFGPEVDAFTEIEQARRRRFERSKQRP